MSLFVVLIHSEKVFSDFQSNMEMLSAETVVAVFAASEFYSSWNSGTIGFAGLQLFLNEKKIVLVTPNMCIHVIFHDINCLAFA